MTDYGIETWDASQNQILEHVDALARLVYSNVITVTQGSQTFGSVDLSDIDGKSTAELALPLDVFIQDPPVVVQRSGTIISWSTPNYADYNYSDSIIFVFIYD